MAFSEIKTTIVVGAGASRELDLPTGRELKDRIAKLLDLRYQDGGRVPGGSSEIDSALRTARQQRGDGDFNAYLHACWAVRDAMPLAISIDNFLDAHSSDEKVVLAGKLAIAQAILDAERKSPIYIDRHQNQSSIKFGKVQDCWLNRFVQLLTENRRFADLPDVFSALSIVCFNYDRCIEHFLLFALSEYYRVPLDEAAEALRSLTVFHPYGRVGSLPWQKQSTQLEFGADSHSHTLLNIASEIRTFTEGMSPSSGEAQQIREAVAACDRLIFLGFAFHPLNMELITPAEIESAPRSCYGTALGISAADSQTIERDIRTMLEGIDRVDLRNDLTCTALFDEYRRSMSLGR